MVNLEKTFEDINKLRFGKLMNSIALLGTAEHLRPWSMQKIKTEMSNINIGTNMLKITKIKEIEIYDIDS